MIDLEGRYEEACAIGQAAGRLAIDRFHARDGLTVERKGTQDVVSLADREVEDMIRRELAHRFPDDAILGEEGGGTDAERIWVIDPIDGTSNFLRGLPYWGLPYWGLPYWGVVLAFVVDGVTEIGITADPVHGELFAARRGHGAFRNGKPIHVSSRTRADESCVAMSYSFKQGRADLANLVRGLHERRIEQRRLGCTAINLCLTADGRLDGTLCTYCNSWDCLAGLILVDEAGGVATHCAEGGHSLLEPRAIAACTPALVDELR